MSFTNGKGIVLPCGNAKKAKSFGCYYSVLDQRPKTRQKLDFKRFVKLPGYTNCQLISKAKFSFEPKKQRKYFCIFALASKNP
jgi:hypothetical protein